MSDSVQRFYLEEEYSKDNEKETISADVLNILDLFRLLSAEEKLKVKQLIKEEKIWN